MQNISKGSFLKKKWFVPCGDLIEYKEDENIIYINSIPNCIYDQNTHVLYFTKFNNAYAIFSGLKDDYKEATAAEKNTFLSSDIVEAVNFDNTNVGVANRKRITLILSTYNAYNGVQKDTLKSYIREKVGNTLEFTNSRKFKIVNDQQLKILLMGIQQRLYIIPLQEETQVATSTTKLSNIMK